MSHKGMARNITVGLSVLMGIGVFLFWNTVYPHALSYQEQYQLFLWTGDYLRERVSVPGGVADWLGEFIVQFYRIEWLGALLLALLFVALQQVVRMVTGFGLLSFVPSVLLLWLLGDPSVLLGYVMALIIAISSAGIMGYIGRKAERTRVAKIIGRWGDVLIVPIVYWGVGPLAWVYVLLRMIGNAQNNGWKNGWELGWIAVYLAVLQVVAYHFLLTQWLAEAVMLPMQYYRIPLMMNGLMWGIPLIIIILAGLFTFKKDFWQTSRTRRTSIVAPVIQAIEILGLAALTWTAISKGYDKDMYELIRQDYLVRNERWDEVVKRAQEYQVKTPFWSNCVNLALAQKRQLADRMFDFYQSGEDALLMPRVRDLTSMLPTAEAFWRLGMVNSAQRYIFDTQESILNGRKSGRCTQRIAECMLVNGHYRTATKQLDLLKKTLFYREWAQEAEALLGQEEKINAHPVYGKLRRLRYKEDFLYSYEEMDKMLGLLFMNNPENKMALDYFMGEMLLKGNLQGFQQYMGAVQQYGGYRIMPIGYQDAMRCIQMQGNVPGSPYANYAKRMMAGRRDS